MENGHLLSAECCDDETFDSFLAVHKPQLQSAGIPECKWRILCYKLCESVFDAGDDFIFYQEVLSELEDSESNLEELQNSASGDKYHWRVYTKCAMLPDDDNHIYLIDHAWTYTLGTCRKTLEEQSTLVKRICSLMNITFVNRPVSDVINDVLKEMWKYNYSFATGNEDSGLIRCWYIMDEFGSRINYADDPSFKIVPFFFTDHGAMYSILFPNINVDAEEEVTCGYPRFSNMLPEVMQKAVKYPWEPCDLSYIDFHVHEPDMDYFASGRNEENYLNAEEYELLKNGSPVNREIKVYTEYDDVAKYLSLPMFKIVHEKGEANILWLYKRIYDYKQLIEIYSTFYYVNQFPSEQVLINKDLLAIVSRRCCNDISFDSETLESYPEWLPTTYSLLIELPQFISYFQNREQKGLDNVWICKPFNLARGIDIYITDNLNQIIRLTETRPMVACKYISDPVLFPKENVGLVKMDIRFIALLNSVEPLELYVYERFWLRFANKPFTLNDYEDYEKHFTVMNYGIFPLQQMYCHDFIDKFEEFYTLYKWNDIQESIYKMIKEIFVASTFKKPPAGIGAFPGSRAMYGLDIMLAWDRSHDVPIIKPMILEVNRMPDCKRACEYYPEFYNDVFSVLFLGDTEGKHVIKL